MAPSRDPQSNALILQEMKYSEYGGNRDSGHWDLDDEVDPPSADPSPKIDLEDLVAKKGQAFRHTSEYYEAIRNEAQRMQAYRDVTVTDAPLSGEDAEIAANPFKFLYLPEDATFGQTRAAYLQLSKAYFPDLLFPENKAQYKRIFGEAEPFPIGGTDYSAWSASIANIRPPATLSIAELEKLSVAEQEEYGSQKAAYERKEQEYEFIKTEMRVRATKLMVTINKAYEAAKKRFSESETHTFAGFEWSSESHVSDFMKALLGEDKDPFRYDKLALEGPGQLRRNMGGFGAERDPRVVLVYDYGEVYLDGRDYRQTLPLKTFFAWTELAQGREVTPTLLDDMVTRYHLNVDQSEQLRLMIMNREAPDFIVKALELPTKQFEEYRMIHFLEFIYNGPQFVHDIIGRETFGHPLGVEITQEEGLILRYHSQYDSYSLFASPAVAQFTPMDFQIMISLAYGPLLAK